MSEDPIGFLSGDINHYRYVFNNPLIFNDPSGLMSAHQKLFVAGAMLAMVWALKEFGFEWIIPNAIPAEPKTEPKPKCDPKMMSCPPAPQPKSPPANKC